MHDARAGYLVTLGFAAVLASAALAQEPPPAPAAAPPADPAAATAAEPLAPALPSDLEDPSLTFGAITFDSAHSADTRELGAFLDGLVTGLMDARHVPGAVLLLVEDGHVAYQKGYGTADPATDRPVDPETTLFRVASVSKLFTATAVMQLVEQGKIDLDADLNQYLEGFAVLNCFGKPVTVRNLLTHTGGFDDRFVHSTVDLGAPALPLGEYLAQRMPSQAMPPGDNISYSNHGLALAGYIVERVSGQPFEVYVSEHIFQPLGMTHSGFGLPTPLPPEMAVGTNWKKGQYVPSGYDKLLMGPAGDLYTSAGDISKFMLAHLQDGRFDPDGPDAPAPEVRILGEATAREMHKQHFTHHPKLSGWALGFEEDEHNGLRTIEHGGSWRGFGTTLVLIPEKQMGLFVSTTRTYDSRFFTPLVDAFFDRVFPAAEKPKPGTAPADFASRADKYTGAYIPSRRIRGDFMKLNLLLSEGKVAANPDGSLTFSMLEDPFDPVRMVEVEPGLFRTDKGKFLAFRTGPDGSATQLFANSFALDRVPWWERPGLQAVAAAACAALFLVTALGYLLGGLVRRFFGGPASGVPRWARVSAVVVSALGATLLIGIGVGLTVADPFELMGRIPLWLTAISLVPFVVIPLSLLIPAALVRSAFSRSWTPFERIQFGLLTVAAAYFAYFCWNWKLLGPIT